MSHLDASLRPESGMSRPLPMMLSIITWHREQRPLIFFQSSTSPWFVFSSPLQTYFSPPWTFWPCPSSCLWLYPLLGTRRMLLDETRGYCPPGQVDICSGYYKCWGISHGTRYWGIPWNNISRINVGLIQDVLGVGKYSTFTLFFFTQPGLVISLLGTPQVVWRVDLPRYCIVSFEKKKTVSNAYYTCEE